MSKFSICFLVIVTLGLIINHASISQIIKYDQLDSEEIVFKVKPEYREYCFDNHINISNFKNLIQKLGITDCKRVFPNHRFDSKSIFRFNHVDLTLIYSCIFHKGLNLNKAIELMRNSGILEYAELKPVGYLHYTPNDPSLSLQYYIGKINAFNAWDIEDGDTNIVIGIVDSGTDWDHPDLQSNIKLNYADPINGIDDDNDGYVDNFRGWDLSDNDNNPMCGVQYHGSHVSGCAAAVTDNSTGVSGVGFKCKFLPVKASKNTSTNSIDNGYEGIVYAADHGCQIINCSWGSPGGGQFAQDVINYATFNKGALVVASAGNNNNNIKQYPAALQNVISVASTNSSDLKSSFSSYGGYVDICAPGSGIYSTYQNNTYTSMDGTSMSSPILAGCAAIVKSHFPNYSGLQCGEQLRVTADDIYNIGPNINYQSQLGLGSGRVNLYRALTESKPSVRYTNIIYDDMNDGVFVVNDTIRISGIIRNYLAPTSNLTLTLSTTNTNVQILNSSVLVGVLGTMDSTDNFLNPFEVKIKPGTPINSIVNLILTMNDGSYVDKQLLTLTVNVDYINVTVNKVFTTITSKGKVGYNQDAQTEGLGFDYYHANGNNNLMYDGGLMIGKNTGAVSDVIRGVATGNDADFQSVINVSEVVPALKSDFDLTGRFNDNPASPNMNLLVSHKSYAWTNVGDDKYVIVEYSIKNNGTTTHSNLFAGLCFDWDIQTYANNKADENQSLKLGYVFCTDPGGLWVGIKVLSPTPFLHYALDNVAGGGGGVDIVTGGFATNEKYQTLSTNRAQAGGTGTGNDVLDVVSTGPFTIVPGDSQVVAFALIAGDDLTDLQQSAINAQIKYNGVLPVVENFNNTGILIFPNPANDYVYLEPIADDFRTKNYMVEIFDMANRCVYKSQKSTQGLSQKISVAEFKPGVYCIRISNASGVYLQKLIKN